MSISPAKPLNDVAGIFFCVSCLSWIQLTLKPQELLTCDWTYKKKMKENINKHLFLFCSCNNMNKKLALTNVAQTTSFLSLLPAALERNQLNLL